MLLDLLDGLAFGGGVDWGSILAYLLSTVFIMLCILPLHEFAHG